MGDIAHHPRLECQAFKCTAIASECVPVFGTAFKVIEGNTGQALACKALVVCDVGEGHKFQGVSPKSVISFCTSALSACASPS